MEKGALVYTRMWSNNPEYFHHGPSLGDSFIVHNQRIDFIDANTNVTGMGIDKKPEYHNYFIGDDPSKWASRVGVFTKVRVSDVYPGIDLEVYGRGGSSVKYDFIVHAGADPEK
ncbi:MAG: hypothetical protein LPK45_09650, partial [Bacteroidota bacterium]|nr:hypothetical protein [Bacteroidota bacterium]MDX5470085.1 hypothetical protein [Bacteroidota bacterium]